MRGGLVCGLLFPESKRRLDLLSAHLHPLAADFDQRLFEFCQGFQFFEREPIIAKGHLPVELDNRVERQDAPCLHLGALHIGAGRQAKLYPLTRPPRRQQDSKACLFQHQRLLGEELIGAGRIQSVTVRSRRSKAGLDARADPRSLTQG